MVTIRPMHIIRLMPIPDMFAAPGGRAVGGSLVTTGIIGRIDTTDRMDTVRKDCKVRE
jgi:hypothetical protein